MSGVVSLLVAAITSTVVQVDQYPLRNGCEENDEVVAKLAAGTPVSVRYGVGDCLAVKATVEGKQRSGFLPAHAVSGAADLDRARQEGRAIQSPAAPQPSAALGRATAQLGQDHPLVKVGKLLESQQPNEAFAAVETMLRENSRDPSLLAMAGYAAWRNDEMHRASGYLRDSLAVRQDPAVEALLGRVERELSSDRSSEKLYGARFLLRYDPAVTDANQARGMLGLVEHEYSRAAFELGCRRDERLVAVLQTREAYRRTMDAAEWTGGQFDGRIHVAIVDDGPGPATQRSLSHEVVHACVASLGEWPAWLHEGLAQYYSGVQLQPVVKDKIRSAARSNMLPRLDRMTQAWSRMSGEHAALAYGMALFAVELFFENYKEFGMRNLLRSPEQLPQISAQLDLLMRR